MRGCGSRTFAIIAIYLCVLFGALLVFTAIVGSAFILRPIAFLAFIAGFCVFVWLGVKVSAAPLFYLRAEKRNLFESIAESFRFIRSAEWWTVFMLFVFILLTIVVPEGLIAFMLFSGLSAGAKAELEIAMILASLLNIIATAWSTAALAAIVSHAPPPPSILTEATAVTSPVPNA